MIIGSTCPSIIILTLLSHQTIQISITSFLQLCNITQQDSTDLIGES